MLLYKKADNSKIGNYRPISLLPDLYKLLTEVITNRLTHNFDAYQPIGQAGFSSTIDHLQSIRTIIGKTRLSCIHCESNRRCAIYILYKNATFHVVVNDDLRTERIRLDKGVHQGDTITISPKLFTLPLKKYSNCYIGKKWYQH